MRVLVVVFERFVPLRELLATIPFLSECLRLILHKFLLLFIKGVLICPFAIAQTRVAMRAVFLLVRVLHPKAESRELVVPAGRLVDLQPHFPQVELQRKGVFVP
jgi:hypothetical protein